MQITRLSSPSSSLMTAAKLREVMSSNCQHRCIVSRSHPEAGLVLKSFNGSRHTLYVTKARSSCGCRIASEMMSSTPIVKGCVRTR